jgi:hypothetical protein
VVDKKQEELVRASINSEALKGLVNEAMGKAEEDVKLENQKISEVLSGLV